MANHWDGYIEPFQIFGNLYFVGTRGVSSHIIDTGDGLILLDTSYPQTVDIMTEGIQKLGFSLQDIKILLHSHGHVDHIGGTAMLKKLTGARAYIGALDADMVSGKVLTNFAEELGFEFNDFFTPDVLLNEGDEIRLGNTVITCKHTPGHTPGTMSYFLDITDGTKTYKCAMMGGSGTNSMEYKHLNKYGLTDRWRLEYPQVIARLRQESVEVQMANHNGDIGVAAKLEERKKTGINVFIDPTTWDKHLDSCMTRYNKMIEDGK